MRVLIDWGDNRKDLYEEQKYHGCYFDCLHRDVISCSNRMRGDKLYFVSGGRYEIPDDVDLKMADLDDYEFAFLDIFDIDGNLLKTVDLGNDIDIQFDNPHKERRSGLYFEVEDNSVDVIKIINNRADTYVNERG